MGKQFHLGDILSVTTGRLVSKRKMDGLYNILNYMTNDNLYTHQLPRASNECTPWLLRQHPQLKDVETPTGFSGEGQVWTWLAEQVDKYGEYLEVEPIPPDDHVYKHPVDELQEMFPNKPVIVVEHDHKGGI